MGSQHKRILLVYAVSYRIQTPLLGVAAPSGLSWIARGLAKRGYDSAICDLTFAKSKQEIEVELAGAIEGYKPHAIGISIRNIDTATDPPKTFYPYLEHVAQTIRELSGVPVIIGGSGFSLYPKECMLRLKADFGIVGEGEKSFADLLDGIFSGASVTQIPGLVYMQDGKVRQNTREMLHDYASVGNPIHDGIDYNRYESIGGFYSIQTKRGCAFKCIYCDYPYLEGKKYRMRNHVDIVDEMQYLVSKFNLRHFFFTDSVFNFPVKLCHDILSEIVARRLDIKWTAYVNPRGMTRELIELFKKSGCSRVEVTVDSAAGPTLETYQKHFGVDEVKKADQYLYEFEIPTYYWINLGGPGESQDTLKEGFETLHGLKNVTKGWLGTGFVVHPGTPLFDLAKFEGRIKATSGDKPYLYISDKMPADFAEQVQMFCVEHPAWYSRYDRLNDDYMEMVRRITRQGIRDHWPLQKGYGAKRLEKFQRGELQILPHNEFQARVQQLGGTWSKGAVD